MTPRKKPRVKKTPPPPTPPRIEPWSIPPPPAEGDKDEDTLYRAVGFALSKWGRLEDTMAHIFASLISGDPLPASRAYGAVLTFKGRMEMTQAAAKAFFFLYPRKDDDEGEDIEKYLAQLISEALRFSARRNEIAHGVSQKNQEWSALPGLFGSTIHGTWFRPIRDPKKPTGFVLCPLDHATSKTELKKGGTILFPVAYVPDYVYSSAEVLAFAEHFERLNEWASNFPLAILNHHRMASKHS